MVFACKGSRAGMSLRAMPAWRARSSATELRLPRGAGELGGWGGGGGGEREVWGSTDKLK